MRFAVLGSGSSANSYIFEDKDFSFLIDNGFSVKELSLRAKELNFDLGKLHFILITHTHDDHVRGAGTLSRKLKIPVVMHKRIPRKTTDRINPHELLGILPDKTYNYGSLEFIPFTTSHDAPHPVGYHFSIGNKRFTLLTDTGVVPEKAKEHVKNSDVVFLESNYDAVMLEKGPYPVYLKKRIASSRGHLSNTAAMDFINELGGKEGPSLIYLCHLSAANNSVEKVRGEIEARVLKNNRRIVICGKGEMIPGEDDK